MSRVLNKHHGNHEKAVYIGRPSPYGNPFSHLGTKGTTYVPTRADAVAAFEELLYEDTDLLIRAKRELAGHDLECWCAPKACHGDILMRVANPKQHKLYVIGPRDQAPPGALVVNTTSRSSDFGFAFSPFLNQGTVAVGDLFSHNVENLWQFSKVYEEHANDEDAYAYFAWRDRGFADRRAHRYPMGKGRKPLYSVLNGERLDYVTARKRIYVPAYRQKLREFCTRQLETLVDMLTVTDVALWDFDGYLTDDDFDTVLNSSDRKMGHAFIIQRMVAKMRENE